MTKTAGFTVLLAVENKETDLFCCVWVVVTAYACGSQKTTRGYWRCPLGAVHPVGFVVVMTQGLTYAVLADLGLAM